jgi:uncharacterized membrane protein
MLIGMIFLRPLLGAAVGAGAAIPDDVVKVK